MDDWIADAVRALVPLAPAITDDEAEEIAMRLQVDYAGWSAAAAAVDWTSYPNALRIAGCLFASFENF